MLLGALALAAGPPDWRSQISDLTAAFERTVDEGEDRLHRSWPRLLTTGLVGGADVSLGVFALLIVRQATGDELLSALAFPIGFVALTLANSELFTEDFLVPIVAVAAQKASLLDLLRLWFGTMVTNLIAGWLIMGLVLSGFPKLGKTAVEVGHVYPALGVDWRSFAGALLGGAVITLMTWMERSTTSVPGKLLAAIVAAFLLAAAPLNHAIVVSLEMFAGMQHGAPYGYLDWLGVLGWYSLGNIIGGVVLVAGLRLVQVGESKLNEERRRPAGQPREEDDVPEAD